MSRPLGQGGNVKAPRTQEHIWPIAQTGMLRPREHRDLQVSWWQQVRDRAQAPTSRPSSGCRAPGPGPGLHFFLWVSRSSLHMCRHDRVSVLFLFYWKQPVVLCAVRLELMMELAHNWFQSVSFRVSIYSPCPVRGGQGGCDRRPSGWPREARSPRSGLGGARGRASGPLSLCLLRARTKPSSARTQPWRQVRG